MNSIFFFLSGWTLILITAFTGLGYLIKKSLQAKEILPSWPLESTLGMATLTLIGGTLALFRLVSPTTELLTLGVGLLGAYLKIKEKKFSLPTPSLSWLLWTLPIITLLTSINWLHEIDPNDDYVSYLDFPKKLLETGTLLEPFSFQRAGTMGGYAFLQSYTLLIGDIENLHLMDRGIAQFLFFAILWQITKKLDLKTKTPLLLSASLVVVPRISTSSSMIGGIMLSTFFLLLLSHEWRYSKKGVLLGSLLLAGMATVKPTFAIAGGAILLGESIWESFKLKKFKATPLLLTSSIAGVLLIPWMIILTKSNGAALIPPLSGNINPDYQCFNFQNPIIDFTKTLSFFLNPEILCLVLLGIVATNKKGKETFLFLSILAASFLLVYKFTALAYLDLYRYLYPILFTTISILAALRLKETKIINILLILWIILGLEKGTQQKKSELENIGLSMIAERYLTTPLNEKAYKDIQEKIPPGETILASVDETFCLNSKRNTINNINFVGAYSPHKGLILDGPNAMSSEDFRKYLLDEGIHYILTSDFNHSNLLYTRKLWNHPRPEWFYGELWSPKFLHYMDIIEELEKTKEIGREGKLHLIKLN